MNSMNSMNSLVRRECTPCRGGDSGIGEEELAAVLPEIPEWSVVESGATRKLTRTVMFKNFAGALAFTNRVGELAESQNHHPRICTEWGKVTVTWWTHTISDLHLNDCTMAARTDEIVRSL